MLMSKGEKIKIYRKKKGLSQTNLAKLLGYKSRSVICDIEKNRQSFPLSKLEKLSEILGISSDYILGITEDSLIKVNKLDIAGKNNIGIDNKKILSTSKIDVDEIKEKMKLLKNLFDEKIIDEKEFTEKKKELLSKI